VILCFVGMSGVGKSFWAKRFEPLGFHRYDCDGEIAKHLSELVSPAPGEEPVHALGRWMGMPWSEGHREREARYLALEARVTREALDTATDRAIVDTTGSVIYLDQPFLDELRAETRVVYLRTPEARREAMLKRYLEEPKPVVWGDSFAPRAGESPAEALPRCYEELLAFRDARYTALAHLVLDGGELEANPPSPEALLSRLTSG
jgi:shikimate kinase